MADSKAATCETQGINWGFVTQQEGGEWLVGYVPNLSGSSGVTILNGFDLGRQKTEVIEKLPIDKKIIDKLLPFVGLRGPEAATALGEASRYAISVLDALNRHQSTAGIVKPTLQPPQPRHGDRKHPAAVTQWTAVDEKYLVPHGKTGVKINPSAPASARKGLILEPEEATALAPHAENIYLKEIVKAYTNANAKTPFRCLPSDVQTAVVSLTWHRGYIWNHPKSTAERQVFDAAVHEDWEDVVDTFKGIGFFGSKFRPRRYAEGDRAGRGKGIDAQKVGPKQKAYNAAMSNLQDSVNTLGKLNSAQTK